MPLGSKYQNRIELLLGTLDMLILQAMLNPALHRLEKVGWLASESGTSDKGQRAKYHRLTAAGKKQEERT